MLDRISARDKSYARVRSRRSVLDRIKIVGHVTVICRDKDGNEKWRDEAYNLVVNQGLNEILANGVGAANNFKLGLKSTGAPAPGDTMLSHPTWTEIVAYSEAARPGWNHAGVASQSVNNTASPATFSINGTADVFGAFLTTDATKGGTAGLLIAAVDFSNGNKPVDNGDTLDVSYSLSLAAA